MFPPSNGDFRVCWKSAKHHRRRRQWQTAPAVVAQRLGSVQRKAEHPQQMCNSGIDGVFHWCAAERRAIAVLAESRQLARAGSGSERSCGGPMRSGDDGGELERGQISARADLRPLRHRAAWPARGQPTRARRAGARLVPERPPCRICGEFSEIAPSSRQTAPAEGAQLDSAGRLIHCPDPFGSQPCRKSARSPARARSWA